LRRIVTLAAAALLLCAAGCAPAEPKEGVVVRLPDDIEAANPPPLQPGIYYELYIAQEDHDLNMVAHKKGVSVVDLMRINNLNTTELKEGQAIYIPRKREEPETYQPEIRTERHFIWPVEGTLVTRFGDDIGGANANYILIEAEYGANVRAAKSGIVSLAYEGDEEGLPGYRGFEEWGNFIWITHGGGNATVYAHLAKTFKREGDAVTQGDTIGTVGSSGDVEGPGLRFMIYGDNGLPVNPVPLLP
jgi:murein DD-endopeptidase MepM/ murein hydrolase activator NlpD